MVKGIADVITGLLVIFPPWVLVGGGAVLAVALVPRWVESMRDKQIRGLVRRMVRADASERQRLTAQVTRIVGAHPGRLAAAVHHAIHYDQRALRDSALASLEATGAAPEDVKRLRARIDPAPLRFRDPVEAVVRIEQLLENGLEAVAREQLAIALAAFPDDPDLTALASRQTGQSPPAEPR
jgi:hypothetical protein